MPQILLIILFLFSFAAIVLHKSQNVQAFHCAYDYCSLGYNAGVPIHTYSTENQTVYKIVGFFEDIDPNASVPLQMGDGTWGPFAFCAAVRNISNDPRYDFKIIATVINFGGEQEDIIGTQSDLLHSALLQSPCITNLTAMIGGRTDSQTKLLLPTSFKDWIINDRVALDGYPLISPGSRANLMNVHNVHPYVARTQVDVSVTNKAVAALIRQMKWEVVNILYRYNLFRLQTTSFQFFIKRICTHSLNLLYILF